MVQNVLKIKVKSHVQRVLFIALFRVEIFLRLCVDVDVDQSINPYSRAECLSKDYIIIHPTLYLPLNGAYR